MSKERLPSFDIDLSTVITSLEGSITEEKDEITRIVALNSEPTWDTFSHLTTLDNESSLAIGPVWHLAGVMDSPELREVIEQAIPILSKHGAWVGQHTGFANKVQSLRDSSTLTPVKQRILDKSCLGFELSGINLPKDKQKRFVEISERLSVLSNDFSKNDLDSTKAWTYHTEHEEDLAGVPESSMSIYKTAAAERDMKGFVVTMDAASAGPVLTYCTNRSLREELYKASSTKASAGSDYPEFDNTAIIQEIMELRREKATLLDRGRPADISVISKMADTPEQVVEFLTGVANKAKPQAVVDEQAFQDFVKSKGHVDLQPWDRGFYWNIMKKELYDVDNEKVKEYFQLENVLGGLFNLVEELYGIEVREEQNDDLWHKDVRFYRLYQNDEHFASIYMDLYSDPSRKQSGAWMNDAAIRWKDHDGIQLPVAYNCCNFSPPTDDTPSLLTFRDVETIFHEFGHALHHMLTEVEIFDVSGINGVEWDAVELPSQIMENWCWSKEVIDNISSHYKTGEQMPTEMFDKMVSAKNFMGAAGLLRQTTMSLFDMLIHMEPDQGRTIREVLQDVRDEYSVVETPEYDRFENTFSHIFSGAYNAGYYSYLWAEVLSADAFSVFEQNGIFDTDTAASFRECILSKGGTEPMADNFRAFAGRDPSPDALLKDRGIIT